MPGHRHPWSGLWAVVWGAVGLLAWATDSTAQSAQKPPGPDDFVKSVKTARLVAAGTLAEYRLGGYQVSATGSRANIVVRMNWDTVHFGLRPGARLYRQIPVKPRTKPKLRFKKGDKVLVSWQRSTRDGFRIVPYSKETAQKVARALAARRGALVKKHGADKAGQIERALGILGSAAWPARDNTAVVDHLVALGEAALPVLQQLQTKLAERADRAALEEAVLCLKWKLNPIKLVRDWIKQNARGFGGRPPRLFRTPQRIADPAVDQAFGDTYVLCQLRFPVYPVARMPPKPLRSGNLFVIHKKDKTVRHISQVGDLKKFFLANLSPTRGDAGKLKNAAAVWLKLSPILGTDSFFRLVVDEKGIGIAKGDGWQVTAKAVVQGGGRGFIEAKLRFDPKGKLVGVEQDKRLVPGPRPICQSTKLLDPDPIVRAMAEQSLRTMGTMAREYLAWQRARASPELKEAIDRIWRQILEDERRLGNELPYGQDALIWPRP